MRLEVLTEIPDVPELRAAWNQLASQMEKPEIFYTYEWAISVQQSYQKSLICLICLAYEGESLVGVGALASKKDGEAAFLTADTGDYCDFLSAPGRRQEFVGAIFSELRKRNVTRLVLTNLPADSSSVEAIARAASSRRYHLHLRMAYDCARVVMGNSDERAALKQVVHAKKRLRRNMRELQKRGGVRLQHDTRWEQVEPVLQPFTHAHITRFLETGKISSLVREERRKFLAILSRELSGTGWLAMSQLLVGDTTAAWHYGFRFGGSWFWYQPTVNRIYGDFSPGYCLLANIVEQACDSPEIEIVDLGLGAEGYKERFATASRQTRYCELNLSLSRHLRADLRHRASALATSSPRVEKAIRGIVALVTEWRARGDRGPRALIAAASRRVRTSIYSRQNVRFFEWPAEGRESGGSGSQLCPLDSDLLGSAAIRYGNDPATLRFLMRSAQRLESGKGQGFTLVTAEGIPVHFCWAKDFEGFEMAELNRCLHAPSPAATMIFDCFTPVDARGHGFFSEAISKLAEQLFAQGKAPWIFGAATNSASIRGIENSAFQYRFALGRRRLFFSDTNQDSIPVTNSAPPATPVSTS